MWTGTAPTCTVSTGAASHLGAFNCTLQTTPAGDGNYVECAPAVGNSVILKLGSGTAVYASLTAATASGTVTASKAFTISAELLN